MPIPRALVFFLMLSTAGLLQAQGMFPPSKGDLQNAATAPLLIGETISDTLTVNDPSGSIRTLASYKEPLDVLVVGFFSERCEAKDPHWSAWEHFYKDYKNWHVDFLGFQSDPAENLAELSKSMARAGLPFTILPDPLHKIARSLGVTRTPELVIIDEGFALRYRGPLGKDARQAIEAVIGHVDPVASPEPAASNSGCSMP